MRVRSRLDPCGKHQGVCLRGVNYSTDRITMRIGRRALCYRRRRPFSLLRSCSWRRAMDVAADRHPICPSPTCLAVPYPSSGFPSPPFTVAGALRVTCHANALVSSYNFDRQRAAQIPFRAAGTTRCGCITSHSTRPSATALRGAGPQQRAGTSTGRPLPSKHHRPSSRTAGWRSCGSLAAAAAIFVRPQPHVALSTSTSYSP